MCVCVWLCVPCIETIHIFGRFSNSFNLIISWQCTGPRWLAEQQMFRWTLSFIIEHMNGKFHGTWYSHPLVILSSSDRCATVACAANASCEHGYCRCDAGYIGDGFIRCTYMGRLCSDELLLNATFIHVVSIIFLLTIVLPSAGACANVHCGINAVCSQGRCICEPGYYGDPKVLCDVNNRRFLFIHLRVNRILPYFVLGRLTLFIPFSIFSQ